MAKRKGRKVAAGEQLVIEGTGPEKNTAVHDRAVQYARARDARMAAGEDEKAAHNGLLEAMDKANLTHYEYGDMVVHIDSSRKCKVKTEPKAGGDEDGED